MFALLGNVIWFLTGGFVIGTLYLLLGLIIWPLLPFLLPLVGYSYLPFGRQPVSKSAVKAYKEMNQMPVDEDLFAKSSSLVKFLANTVWVCGPGIILAFLHFLAALANLAICVAIVTIPVALPNVLGNFKMIRVALAPFGVQIVPNSLAEQIENAGAIQKL